MAVSKAVPRQVTLTQRAARAESGLAGVVAVLGLAGLAGFGYLSARSQQPGPMLLGGRARVLPAGAVVAGAIPFKRQREQGRIKPGPDRSIGHFAKPRLRAPRSLR